MSCRLSVFLALLISAVLLINGERASAQSSRQALYEVDVQTTGRDASDLSVATSKGLDLVLRRFVNASGVPKASKARFLKQPTRMLDRYEFVENAGSGYTAKLVFLSQPIKSLLSAANAVYLPERRADILAWVVLDDPIEGKQLITRSGHPVAKGLSHWGEEFGLTIKYPVYDLKDRSEVDLEAVWAFDEARIFAASNRYQSKVLLLGRVNQTADGRYMATWQHAISESVASSVDTRAANTLSLSEQPMRQVFSALVDSFGISAASSSSSNKVVQQSADSSAGGLTLAVDNINSFSRFQRALSYLESLAIIRKVGVHVIDARGVVFRLTSNVDKQRIAERLQVDREFAQADRSQFLENLAQLSDPVDGRVENGDIPYAGQPASFDFYMRLRNE